MSKDIDAGVNFDWWVNQWHAHGGDRGVRTPTFKKMVLEIFPKCNNIGTLRGVRQIQYILTS